MNKVFRITATMTARQQKNICSAHPSCHSINVATRRMMPELVEFLKTQHARGMSIHAEDSRIVRALTNVGVTVASNRSLRV